jgi:hypothetical protein
MTMTTRILASAAAAAAFALAAPAVAAQAAAGAQANVTEGTTVTDTQDADGHRRVFVLTNRHGEAGQETAGSDAQRVRIFKVAGGDMADCTDQPLVDQASPDGHERTKIIVCGHGNALSAAERSTQLEHVMERVQHMDGLSDASKERVTAALREAIEQLRTAH